MTARPLDAHAQFACEALHHRILSADEERALARRWRESGHTDTAARAALVTHNLRLVADLARHYSTDHLSSLDLMQEGTIGLMHAVDKFDERKGNKLTTYATAWIKQAIGRAIDNGEEAIRLPSHVAVTRRRLRRQADAGDAENAEDSAESAAILTALDALPRMTHSLDREIPDAEGMTFGDLIPDPAADGEAQAERMGEADARAGLWARCRAVLTPREARVIALRFGLSVDGSGSGADVFDARAWATVPLGTFVHLGAGTLDGATHTLEDVGRELHVTRERVRQIEMRALDKLRRRLAPDATSGTVTVRVRVRRERPAKEATAAA